MMNVITNAVANSASSMLQMKLLQTLPELLITPLSSLELSLSFIIGGAIRGFVNGILILLNSRNHDFLFCYLFLMI